MAQRFATAQGVRQELEYRVGHALHQGSWDYLVEEGYVEDLLVAESATFSDFERRYRRLEKAAGVSEPVEGARVEKRDSTELDLLSDLAAREASQNSEVVAFRERELSGGLLPWDRVGDWLEQVASDDGPPGGYLHGVRYPEGTEFEFDVHGKNATGGVFPTVPIEVSARNPARGTERLLLAFALPGDTGVRRTIVRPGGRLDSLRRISESLAELFHWQPAVATVFVLTGIPPAYSRAAVTFVYVGSRDRLSPRLVIEVDPSLPATELVALYRSARRELMAPIGGPKRRRPADEKTLAVARFAAENPDGTWEERMGRWNRAHTNTPEWAYDNRRNFQRDVTRVSKRLNEQGVSL